MTKLTASAACAVVLLRLVCGWHFYNEGIKKLDPGFTSAGFLRTAKGPLVPLFRAMVPGPYGAYGDLAAPAELGSRDAKAQRALDAWRADYGARAAAASKGGQPLPADIDPAAPGASIVDRVAKGWEQGLERLGRLGADAEATAAARDRRLGELVNYFHGEGPRVEDLRHEAWRLEQTQAEFGADTTPFQRDRVAQQQGEIWKTMQPWLAALGAIDRGLAEDVAAANPGIDPGRVGAALAERSLLSWIDAAVTATVLGAGICLFLGIATRLAAVLAAGFLLSLILTQPPWIAGADLSAFFTWAVELAALLALAAVGAGRWAGLDGLLHAVRVRFGDLSRSAEPRSAGTLRVAASAV